VAGRASSGSFDSTSRDEAAGGCAQDDGPKQATASADSSDTLRNDKQKGQGQRRRFWLRQNGERKIQQQIPYGNDKQVRQIQRFWLRQNDDSPGCYGWDDGVEWEQESNRRSFDCARREVRDVLRSG
jgi:hypothetical protein